MDRIQGDMQAQIGLQFGNHEIAKQAALQGQHRGESVVQVQDQSSLVSNAMEEASMLASEKSEKTLSKRKLRDTGQAGIKTLELVQQLLQKVPDMGGLDRLKSFLKQLQQQAGNGSQLLQMARNFFRDSAQQYVALKFAREELAARGEDPELVAALDEALKELEETHGPSVRAGLNIGETAAEFAGGGLGDVQQLRDVYRETVFNYGGLLAAYEGLVAQYSEKELKKAIKFLLKALGADLAGSESSVDKAKLQTILDGIFQLEVLGGLHEECANLFDRLKDRGLRRNAQPHDLMSEILKLKEKKWVRADQIEPLPGRFGLHELEVGIYFLREFRSMVGLIPLKAFDDPEQRLGLVGAAQQALDNLIQQEEEAEEG